MAEFHIRVIGFDEPNPGVGNAYVFFSDAKGKYTDGHTLSDEEGYALLGGNGQYITVTYQGMKKTVKATSDPFIYVDIINDGESSGTTLGEITITGKKAKKKKESWLEKNMWIVPVAIGVIALLALGGVWISKNK